MNLCVPPKRSSNMVMTAKKPYVSVYKQKPSPKGSPRTSLNGKANGVTAAPPKPKDPSQMEEFKTYGKHQFSGKIADQYLKKQGSSVDILKDPSWVKTSADIVAAAVLDWATDYGAITFCHWFQPLSSSGFRHGMSGQVYNMMMKFDNKTNELKFDFDGKDLIRGETDGSSYANGGLRATHCAGGYLTIDTSSPIFLRGDVIYIPSIFVSYHGMALDEKTPLLRANDALSKHGSRLLKHLGYDCPGLKANIGLEQELFLIPREQFYRRPDLQFTGRTVIGSVPPRDQEMNDHYMAPLSQSTPALECMREIQDQCWKMGIPLKTRHREVAPNQFEFAPLYGINTVQIDQNLIIMQVIEEVAAKHGLAALLQEKPFNGINGSGKHNNWSISSLTDVPLFLPKPLNEACGNDLAFPVVMAAVVAAFDEHGDMMRCAIASPGNDFRLGAMEAPPAIISTYLGEDMTAYLEQFKNGDMKTYTPGSKELSVGIDGVVPLKVPAEDRNRTSPMPYGGARFEFRAVGSSQNVSLVNTVLNAICAQKFAEFADRIDAGENAVDIAKEALEKHWKVIFNGNGYDTANQDMLTERGVWRIDSGVEAIKRLSDEKNLELFDKLNIMTKEETLAREECMLDHYTGTVEIEAGTLIDMINQHVIPSAKKAELTSSVADLEQAVTTLKAALKEVYDAEGSYEKAKLARVLRLETMIDIRKTVDAIEDVVPNDLWTLATYKELLFLDSHYGPRNSLYAP